MVFTLLRYLQTVFTFAHTLRYIFEKPYLSPWFSLISQSLCFSPSFVSLLWTPSSHQDSGVGPHSSQAEAVKAPRAIRLVSTPAHSQRSNFQPVLNSKHMSNPICFSQITHALKIKPCSAAVLEGDQSVLPTLHWNHLKRFFFHHFFHNACVWVEFLGVWVCFLADICLICCPLSLPMSLGVFSYLCFSILQISGVYVVSQNGCTFFQAKQHFYYPLSRLKRAIGKVGGCRLLWQWVCSDKTWLRVGMSVKSSQQLVGSWGVWGWSHKGVLQRRWNILCSL